MNAKRNEENLQPKKINRNLPRVGITMGDAAGIGTEITLKALADENLKKTCLPIVIGDFAFLQKTARDLRLDYDFV